MYMHTNEELRILSDKIALGGLNFGNFIEKLSIQT